MGLKVKGLEIVEIVADKINDVLRYYNIILPNGQAVRVNRNVNINYLDPDEVSAICHKCHSKLHAHITEAIVRDGITCIQRRKKCPKCGNKSKTYEITENMWEYMFYRMQKAESALRILQSKSK